MDLVRLLPFNMAHSPFVMLLANFNKLSQFYQSDIWDSFQSSLDILERMQASKNELSTEYAQLLLLNRYMLTLNSLVFDQMSSLEMVRLVIENTKAQILHLLQLENLHSSMKNKPQINENSPQLAPKNDLLAQVVKDVGIFDSDSSFPPSTPNQN